MNIIKALTPGEVWKQAYELVMGSGQEIMDGDINLKEIIDLYIIVENADTDHDQIIEKNADKKMISWMVDDNFGGDEPVLNWGYCYGMRFRNFNGVNQVDKIIEKLKKNPEAKSATISLMDPAVDYDGHMPCIVALDFKIRQGKLHITGFFRSQDIGKKIYADILALSAIQNEVADALSTPVGEVKIFISSAHVYEQDFNVFGS